MQVRRRPFLAWAPVSALLTMAIGHTVHGAGIASVSALGDGQQVTIHGSGFGTKINPKPLYYWDFGKSTTQTSSLSRSTYSGVVRGTLSASLVAPGSATALQVDMGGNTNPAGPQDGVIFNSSTVYAWIKHRYEFNIVAASGPNGFNLKTFRLWDPWNSDIYFAYQASWGGTGINEVEYTQESKPATWFGLTPVARAWVIEEYDYQTSGVGVQDGILQYVRNGLAAQSPGIRWTMRDSAHPKPYSLLFFDQVSNNQVAPGTYQYIDSIYVDDSRQRVIVSDEPTWQQSTTGPERHREIQIPVAWSDSQIQLVAHQGSFSSFAGTYLYVIGTDGNPVSAQGFPVAAGAAAAVPAVPAVPNAPASISVK
jgi:hypothetical protein